MLTIIICTFQGGHRSRQDRSSNLERCLTSLRKLSYKGPIIIVDDGSTDDTQDIIRQFSDKLNILMLRNAKNEGLRDSFNLAASYVKTKYLLRVDDDILFQSNPMYAVEHMEAHPECGGCGYTQYLPDGRLWCAGDQLFPMYDHIQRPIKTSYRRCHSIMGCFSCYPTDLFLRLGGITCGKWMRAETEDLNLRIQQAGYEIHCLPDRFLHCHNHCTKKQGTYNDSGKAQRIREHMLANWNLPFYEAGAKKPVFLQDIVDL
jgi:glycosyltransferase involved in cell wall biosynthesis